MECEYIIYFRFLKGGKQKNNKISNITKKLFGNLLGSVELRIL